MSAPWRSELHVEELPAPQRIAPYSAAITADVIAGSEELGSGRRPEAGLPEIVGLLDELEKETTHA